MDYVRAASELVAFLGYWFTKIYKQYYCTIVEIGLFMILYLVVPRPIASIRYLIDQFLALLLVEYVWPSHIARQE